MTPESTNLHHIECSLQAATGQRSWFPGQLLQSAVLTIVTAALLTPVASADDPDWRIEALSETLPLTAPTTIQISNPFGELHVRPAPGLDVEAQATSQRHADDPRRFEIATRRDGSVVYLGIRSTELDGKPPDSWRKRRLDLMVYVPANSPLYAESSDGKVQVRGMRGDVDAASAFGDLDIATHGRVTARTDYGSIRVELLSPASDETHSFDTVTGPIEVDIPWQAGVDAVISTRGVIASDYSIEIGWPHHTRTKTGVIRFRQHLAGHTLRVTSERGDVRVVRKLGVDAPHDPPETTP